MTGRLITLEGGEGAGKSTHARTIAAWLRSRRRDVVQTREPGGSPLAEAIRHLVLGDWAEGVDAPTELLLIFAARAAHLHATVRPALEQDQDVVCDRFIDASWAYQHAGRGLPGESVWALEQLVLNGLRPDLTLVFDIDPQIGLARAKDRGDANRFEAETMSFMQRVRQSYLDRAWAAPDRCVIIDASADQETVKQAVLDVLESRL